MPTRVSRLTTPTTPADRTALEGLLEACVSDGASIGFTLPLSATELHAYWDKILKEAEAGNRVVLCARDDSGTIVGSAQLATEARRNGRHRAEVQKVMVLPSHRRDGTGRSLMSTLETEASARGITLLFLDTSVGRGGAQAFYERLGYRYCGGIPGYALDPDGTPADNAIYAKQLGRPSGADSHTLKPTAPKAIPTPTAVAVRDMIANDWPAVRRIHAEGIATGNATFAEEPSKSWDEFISGKVPGCCLVATSTDGDCLGWAVLSPTSSRATYAGVTEASIYVAAAARGLGVGSLLTGALTARSEELGIWTIVSGTFPENTASIALQLRHGFRIIGCRKHLGRMTHGPLAGRWRDVLLLERRSPVTGIA